MGLAQNKPISPFLIHRNLPGEMYLDLSDNLIILSLQHDGQLPQDFWFQQDGAPSHYDRRFKDIRDINLHIDGLYEED